MKKRIHSNALRQPRFSPLTAFALILAVMFTVAVATHPASVSAKSLAVAPTPPAATPPPATPPTYPNAPKAGVEGIPAIQAATGAPLAQDAVTNYVQSHRVLFNSTSDRGKVTTVGEYPSSQIAARLGISTGLPDDTMLWYVEMAGHFVFPGNSQMPQGVTFPYAYEAFNAITGNLVLAGGLAGPTQAATPTPAPATPTPVATTPIPATPTSAPPACTIVSQGSPRWIPTTPISTSTPAQRDSIPAPARSNGCFRRHRSSCQSIARHCMISAS